MMEHGKQRRPHRKEESKFNEYDTDWQADD